MPPRPPYLQSSSPAYHYHRLVWQTGSGKEAARLVAPSKRQVERWRKRLRQKTAEWLQVPVSEVDYWYALRCLFEPEKLIKERSQALEGRYATPQAA